jgi:hypothetical protein
MQCPCGSVAPRTVTLETCSVCLVLSAWQRTVRCDQDIQWGTVSFPIMNNVQRNMFRFLSAAVAHLQESKATAVQRAEIVCVIVKLEYQGLCLACMCSVGIMPWRALRPRSSYLVFYLLVDVHECRVAYPSSIPILRNCLRSHGLLSIIIMLT